MKRSTGVARWRGRGEDLRRRVDALEIALESGRSWLTAATVDQATQAVHHARARVALSVDHTVVALAGSTGSGKSTLLNAVAGTDVAEPGTRRPTTSEPLAAVWDVEDASTSGVGELLDWLEVSRRTFLQGPEDHAGLVLLDLPDHDSVVVEHRVRAERLVERADLLVWVVDPQKYADAALHERYLVPLAGHADIVVVVLNQIDRLSPVDQEQCLADLRRLVAADGLVGATVLGVSALTGQGMGDLGELLGQAAAKRAASTDRLVADVRAAAAAVAEESGSNVRPGAVSQARDRLLEGLEQAARVDVVVDAVRGSALLRAHAATGWPVTRWAGRFRADPLRRLNLHRSQTRSELSRTSLPVPDAAMAARSQTAVRSYVDAASAGAPARWVLRTRDAVRYDGLPDALDQAVARTELDGTARPVWWRVASAVQWVFLAVMVAGLAWLGALAVLAFTQIPVPNSPDVEGFPIPTLLAVGGFALGVVTALLSRVLALLGASRAARRAARRLRTQIEVVAVEMVVAPVETHRRLLDECRAAAAVAGR